MVASGSHGGVISTPPWAKSPSSTVLAEDGSSASGGIRKEIVRHLPALRRFASSLCGSRADAEDLVQASIERALCAQEQWREGTRLDSWLFRIAQNLWRDQGRAVRIRTVALDQAAEVEGEDGREVAARRADLRVVQGAFAELPIDQQCVVVLVLQGASYEQAALALGVPKGTIMSRLARARAALASKVTDRSP
jgi:RNA polymerase sigma-70 factor (ECF subfamily)